MKFLKDYYLQNPMPIRGDSPIESPKIDELSFGMDNSNNIVAPFSSKK